ncbi:unnamed protein product [Pieris brassicae]|uniref:Uncharacterized protein n=1 Tax=Pieris brassicae TaxID=7116 RepID=A0A9P0X961_PIEBR|nr:unnamed protein product [Pieris brassicae]
MRYSLRTENVSEIALQKAPKPDWAGGELGAGGESPLARSMALGVWRGARCLLVGKDCRTPDAACTRFTPHVRAFALHKRV